MIARPAMTALGCRSCRTAIYRAVLPSAAPSTRLLPRSTSRPSLRLGAQRSLSTGKSDETLPESEAPMQQSVGSSQNAEQLAQQEDDEPWFLQEAPPRHPPSQHKPTLPTAPPDSPAMLDSMIKYVYEDMGLDDLSILDLRDLDPQASLGPNLIMLFGTARSERHLHISAGRFIRWLKRTHNISSKGEGLIGAGELKTKLRRLRKKAKLMGQSMTLVPGADNGISTGWVCVNFRTTDDTTSESASFDDSGRISGFGSSETGTTVVVQCMTEARRTELNLEKLWKDLFRRNLKEQARVRDETPSDSHLDQILASKLQLHETPGTSQFEAMQRASQQHRYYSTSARRLQSLDVAQDPPDLLFSQPPPRPRKPEVQPSNAEGVWADFINVQINGAPLDLAKLQSLISDVFRAPLEAGLSSSARLGLADQLLQTADERGLEVRSREVLVTLIESIVVSPAYAQDLVRAQRNFELLLRDLDECPTEEELIRLMKAYWVRADWNRFWKVLSTPTRFNQPRSHEIYELAFRAAAGKGSKIMATDMIRRLWPEMQREQPPVLPVGSLVKAIEGCIHVADHKALNRHAKPLGRQRVAQMRYLSRRKYKGSEMLRVLRELRTSERLAANPPPASSGEGVPRTLPQMQAADFKEWAETNLTWRKPRTPKRNKADKEAKIRAERDYRVMRRKEGAKKAKAVYLARRSARKQSAKRVVEETKDTDGVVGQMLSNRRRI